MPKQPKKSKMTALLLFKVFLFLNNVGFLYSFVLPQSYQPLQAKHQFTKLTIPQRINSYLHRNSQYLKNERLSTTNDNQEVENENNIESKKKLRKDFLSIAVPALIQLAAEPLAGLVDTAYLGRLGPEVLGGAGVAISAQYAIAKLYNDPLLRTSISLVAAQDAKSQSEGDEGKNDDLAIAVSSALLLALSVGFIQLFIYSIGSNWIIKGPMGEFSIHFILTLFDCAFITVIIF